MADFSTLFPGFHNSGQVDDTTQTKQVADLNIRYRDNVNSAITNNASLANTATKGSINTSARQAAYSEGNAFNTALKSKYALQAVNAAVKVEGIQMRHQVGIVRAQSNLQNLRMNHGIQMRQLGQEMNARASYTETIFEVLDNGTDSVAAALMS